jgi:hypothetical protein
MFSLEMLIMPLSHRVGRFLSFSPVVGIGTLPPPLSPASVPPGEFAPPPFSGGRGTLAGERGGWESPNSDERTYSVVLCKYMYFVP